MSTIFGQRAAGSSHPTEVEDAGGIDTQAESPGLLLHRLRVDGGDWLGVVTYPVRFADRGCEPIYLERQLVPARAL